MELRQQLNRWSEQAEAAGEDAKAHFDVAQRLLKHGIGALDEIDNLHKLLRDIKAWDVNQYMLIPHELRARIESALPPNVKLRGDALLRRPS